MVSGKIFRKYPTAMAISPNNPRDIKPSETLNGIDWISWLKAGPSNRRCSNQMPTITIEQIMIMRIGLVLMSLFNRMKKGPTKQTINNVQAYLFQGANMVRTIT